MNSTDIKHIHEIIGAALAGKPIWNDQYDIESNIENVGRLIASGSSLRHIRIKPDPSQEVAPGKNTHGLTVAQVGEGYRILDDDEIHPRRKTYKEIEDWKEGLAYWDATGWEGSGTKNTYRTKLSREAIAALDGPKTRAWNCAADVPGPVCWIRKHGEYPLEMMVVAVWENGFAVSDSSGVIKIGWQKVSDLEYSTDRKTWHKCETEVCP